MTQLQTSLDDDLSDTRLLSCRVLGQLFTHAGRDVDQHRLHAVYPHLLKRLDDSSDDVRLAAADTFSAYLHCFHDNYDATLYRAHLDAIYHGLLVHLDDQHSNIQRSILGSLIHSSPPAKVCSVAPELVPLVFRGLYSVLCVALWLSGRALDLRFTGRGFNSWPVCFHVT